MRGQRKNWRNDWTAKTDFSVDIICGYASLDLLSSGFWSLFRFGFPDVYKTRAHVNTHIAKVASTTILPISRFHAFILPDFFFLLAVFFF